MTISIIVSVILGALVGYFFVPASFMNSLDFITIIVLNVLIFFIGIDIGQNKHIFKDIKKHGSLILLIPLSIVIGSLVGGLLTGLIFHIPSNKSLAVASGFGWYSLSGILIAKLDGPKLGTIAFLTNVFRELITVISVPFLAKYLNHYTAIAPAGATSMDTTLPIISRYTDPEIVIISFVNGVILSSLVPFLVPFFMAR
ncbi:MAG: lysine exporter LysO family protein [Clostridiaceae bacterium]